MRIALKGVVAIALVAMTPASGGAKPAARTEIYNIYASAQQYTGREVEITNAKIEQLRRCRITAYSDYTFRYQGMTPDLMITFTGPHPSLAAANAELERAKRCGIVGYVKRARLVGGE